MTSIIQHRRDCSRAPRRPRQGIILLIVLGSLTFFSILLATFLAFSRHSKATSVAIAKRNTQQPDSTALMNDALMMLIRGTDDGSSPFYGEDLLSDYYGRFDASDLVVHSVDTVAAGPLLSGTGFLRFPVSDDGTMRPIGLANFPIDDVFSGRLITFTEGPLTNRTFRVIRSEFVAANGGTPAHDNLYIDLDPEVFGGEAVAAITADQVRALFYEDPADLTVGGFEFHVNGAVRNSAGVGLQGGNLNATVQTEQASFGLGENPNQPISGANPPIGFVDLPISLQPNHFGVGLDKENTPGDFDEAHDAADHHNWFLSYRRPDGTVIPSFHRPAVLNYILNEVPDWTAATDENFRDLAVSLQRATFRPIPIAAGQLDPPNISASINAGFDGGNGSFALRTANRMDDTNVGFLDQFARALIDNNWDVDNDRDGINDSVWVDLGLPIFTAPDGKLVRPLVAPMIEDLGGRLNINGMSRRDTLAGGLVTDNATWAKLPGQYGVEYAGGATPVDEFVFQGLGYGPADLSVPVTVAETGFGTIPPFTPAQRTGYTAIVDDLFNLRYRYSNQTLTANETPGTFGRDFIHLLRNGYLPRTHTAAGGFGYPSDSFGRGGYATGRSGHQVLVNAGVAIRTAAPLIDEAINTPYESDPSGRIAGDAPYTFAEFEALLRQYDFDTEMLPSRLRDQWNDMRLNVGGGSADERLAAQRVATAFAQSITPHSVSSDHPSSVRISRSPVLALMDTLRDLAGTTPLTRPQMQTLVDRLVPFEMRLGNKLDLNRRFGNGIDDTPLGDPGSGVIDEPAEIITGTENETFVSADGVTAVPTAPVDYTGIGPDYDLNTATVIPNAGRQLLARHLYVLMMMVTRDLNNPTIPAPRFPVTAAATPLPTANELDLYRARRIAQWAVNVVDYADPDSIMTAFEYDPDPFTVGDTRAGWDVDGDLLTTETLQVSFDGGASVSTIQRPVVWGVESPELVFSESLATHDVRLRDTDLDSGVGTDKADTTMPDPDTDQVRLPQGSLFLELYCPRPVITTAADSTQNTKPALPAELYSINANGVGTLDLDRRAPQVPGGAPNGAPVWRIAITQRHDAGTVPNEDPSIRRDQRPDTASFDIFDPDEIDSSVLTPAATLAYDRFIIFNNIAGTATDPDAAFTTLENLLNLTGLSTAALPSQRMAAAQVFYAPTLPGLGNVNTIRDLQVGQYLTLAPRSDTRMGSREVAAAYPGVPSNHGFATNPAQGVITTSHNNTRLTPLLGPAEDYMPALPMVIAAPRPDTWGPPPAAPNRFLQNGAVGISVSEPLPRGGNYYPEPTSRLNGNEDLDGANGEDYPLTDAYIDFSTGSNTARDQPLDLGIGRIPNNGVEPITGTVNNYCTAFLQRLADPTVPFNEVTNPYRTMDWITVDLTVFSGEERESSIAGAGNYATRSRQRNGAVRNVVDPVGGPNNIAAGALFSYETSVDGNSGTVEAGNDHYFILTVPGSPQPHLGNSLSTLNNTDPLYNAGYVGFADSIGTTGATEIINNDRNLPQIPFAMHPWLNRPYATPYELLMVPACSQARLFEEFSVISGTDPPAYPSDNPAGYANLESFRGDFRHLLNFFFSSTSPNDTPEMVRLFELVHTRPQFAGEVDVIAPTRIAGGGAIETFLQELLSPPFNTSYNDTRLATVNLNSVSTFQTWAGLMRAHLNEDEYVRLAGTATADQLSFNNFLINRRGYTPDPLQRVTTAGPNFNYDPNHLNSRYPTEFAGNFRNPLTSEIEIDLRDGAAPRLQRRGTSVTLHRGDGPLAQTDPNPPAAATLSEHGMFVRQLTQQPLATAQPHMDRFRSPANRFQTLMRMPNLASNNSQVFLIRMTLGFFEVDAETLSLGDELNAEFGTSKRISGLFVIDRSIPVGFLPGQDTNVADTIVYQSITE